MTIAELAEDASYWRQHIESTRAATLSQTPLDAALVEELLDEGVHVGRHFTSEQINRLYDTTFPAPRERYRRARQRFWEDDVAKLKQSRVLPWGSHVSALFASPQGSEYYLPAFK